MMLRNLIIRSNSIGVSKMSTFVVDSFTIDRYKCAKINLDNLVKYYPNLENINGQNTQEFEALLVETLKKWREDKVRASWFKCPLKFSGYVPSLIKNGYVYHHAKPEFAMLVKWLSDGTNNIPQYPYTNVGVGGIVIDDDDKVLVVKEKYFIPGRNYWKFPGGYSNQGEEIDETIRREILEETGIDTQFVSMIAFRHKLKYQFGSSDLYFACHLKPVKSESNPNLTTNLCDAELLDCTWMQKDQLIDQLSDFNRYIFNKFIKYREKKCSITSEKVNYMNEKNSVYAISFQV